MLLHGAAVHLEDISVDKGARANCCRRQKSTTQLVADEFVRQLLGGYVERDIVSPEVMTEVARGWAICPSSYF